MQMQTGINLAPIALIAVALVGLIVLTLGVRGRPDLSSPRCARCSYDLRAVSFMSEQSAGVCPECGAQLSESGAVSFGKWRRQPRLVIGGLTLIALPVLVGLGLGAMPRSRSAAMVAAVGPANRSSQPTSAILASLPKSINAPWDWQELDRRLRAGSLSAADVSSAVGILITQLQADRAAGRPP